MIDLLAPDLRSLVQDVLAFSLCVAAFVWGGGPERAVAASWMILFELPFILHLTLLGGELQLTSVDLYLASADFLAAAIWILVALYANRNYTLFIAGLQVVAVLAHLARGMAEMISPIAYITMVVAPGWLQLFFLTGGLAFHIRRKKQFADYRDWRFSSGSELQFRLSGMDQWVWSIATRRPGRKPK